MSRQNTLLNTYTEDVALRVGDFRLLPVNPKAPIIQSHPISNFSQLTYTRALVDAQSDFKPVTPIFNVFTVLKNTAIEWRMYVIDPSSINNPADTSNITYVWKRNGNPIYELNRLNERKGTPQVFLDETSVTAEVAGEYICEVSNEYGTVTTTPFIIDVLDVDNNPAMFKNLIVNGDGAGGLDGWLDVNGSYQVRSLIRNEFAGIDSTIADYTVATGSLELTSYPFNFSAFSQKNLFYPVFSKILQAQPQFTDLNIEPQYNANGTPIGLSDYEWWNHTAAIPTVIANEDFAIDNSPQGFFPGPVWIDKYNNNSSAASKNLYTLADELDFTKNNITYFTQTRFRFLQPGEDPEKVLAQSVDVSAVSAAIDGKVAGLDAVIGRFFAYVGLAISRYEILYIEGGTTKRLNWYVTDLDTYRKFLRCELGGKFRIKPDKNTPIQIIPYTDDEVLINLKAYNESGELIQTVPVNTPTIQDLWTVKEKAFFPLILYPLFAFFEPRDNDIKVFNNKYTNTSALLPLFYPTVSFPNKVLFELDVKQIKESIENLEELLELKTIYQFRIDRATALIARAGLSTTSGISQEDLQQAELEIATNTSLLQVWETEAPARRQLLAERKAQLINLESQPEIFYGESALHPNKFRAYKSASEDLGLDRNAAFFINRYGSAFLKNGNIYPTTIWEPTSNENGQIWYQDLLEGREGNRYRALTDPGASAFFAVSARQPIIQGTRLVSVEITMKNNSPALTDPDPQAKGWTQDEIYNLLFNVGSADPLTKKNTEKKYPLHKYREPRCAITKIKYQLQPDNIDRPNNHITYATPPESNTVLGAAKRQLNQEYISTNQPGPFYYKFIKPKEYDQTEAITLTKQEQVSQDNLIQQIQQGLGTDAQQPQATVPAGYGTSSLQAKPKTSTE